MHGLNVNAGFDGRVFLSQSEWETYLKRKPVRYIKKKKVSLCEICLKEAEENNPIQNAHIIAFGLGVAYLALTPEYVDSDLNIISAHRKSCNNQAELNIEDSCRELMNRGIKSLPDFLPGSIQNIWSGIKNT